MTPGLLRGMWQAERKLKKKPGKKCGMHRPKGEASCVLYIIAEN